ncbi:hypothetical protein [Bartonella machadoae]|uniref:hypothetical protein n=1 Tax=Bartonella machadoae TaxID=2893471 RepID=UPI001F4C9556|nr:hypothetical protein [Bartonella machadoae]UNE53947.1 hypothetical protein LNM86_10250 [Bartonella machadoae]
MFIKTSLFRKSILIIALFTTYLIFIFPSNGYTDDDLDEFCCSKEIVRLEKARNDYLYQNYLWWRQRYLEAAWMNNQAKPLQEKYIKTVIHQWHTLIMDRNITSHYVLDYMHSEIKQMQYLAKAKRDKQHEEVSERLDIINSVRRDIAIKKEKVERLDREIKTVYKILIRFLSE